MKTVKLISFHPDAETRTGLLKQPGVTVDSAPLVRTSAVIGEMASATRIRAKTHLALCFVRSLSDLPGGFELLLTYNLPEGTSAWVVYPKSAPKQREFNENDVRRLGLDAGLVDYKICSVDAKWSAMKFARRKKA